MERRRTPATPAPETDLEPEPVMSELSFHQLAGPSGACVLAVAGEADSDTAPALAIALDAALCGSPAPETLIVDCSGLRFCACAGLNELLRAHHAAAEAGVGFALATLSPQVARLLDLTGTRTVLEVLPTAPTLPTGKPQAPAQARPCTRVSSSRTAPAAKGVSQQVAELTAEAERQTSVNRWDLSAASTELARATATRLGEAVGSVDTQEALPGIERLERLREALAVVAVGTSHTHGQLAWFLARATLALTPVLRWRALIADQEHAFGTVVPTPEEFTDAENAVRHLQSVLACATTHGFATLQPVRRSL
ncbi:STAS domain-containing protein [Streptomyces sp. NPDC057674]|uniref:STAS domain-containing protein n=1 Tax=Streptomyces sp. NPDC057674 TaxID=3346203 RepID=UPI0036AB0D4B